MGRRKKKPLNKALAIFCAIVFIIIGAGVGIASKIYLFPDDSYIIPDTHTITSSSVAGDIDVDVVKSKELSIHFVELGNKYTGDCTFIKVGNNEILIDAGSRTSSIEPIHDYITQYITDGKLEYVIVTHAHRDHYAGFATNDSLFDALQESDISIGTVVRFSNTEQNPSKGLYKEFLEELDEVEAECGANVYTVLECWNQTNGASKTYDLGNNVELEFLYQEFYETEAHSENDYSVCCILNQGAGADSRHYLFTGDLEYTGEASLVRENTLPKCELYKAGHHGSKTSSSDTLLNVIEPEIVCVCACAGSSEYTSKNENQFPTQQFIDRIAPHTDRVYVTSLCVDYDKGEFTSMNGNIIIASNISEATNVYCSGSQLKLKESEWFKNNRTMPVAWAS